MFSSRIAVLLFTSFCMIQVSLAADTTCRDKLTYCKSLASYCNQEEYKEYTRENCPVTCKQCPLDIDPNRLCLTNNGGCEQKCTVIDKTKKACTCLSGYSLSPDGRTCTDNDECRLDNICKLGETCRNLPGHFTCEKTICKDRKNFQPYFKQAKCCRKVTGPDAWCGVQYPGVRRIVGGNTSRAGQWPWQVFILIDNSILCGGTLLNEKYVITAGHCFDGYTARTDMKLYFGLLNINERNVFHAQLRKVGKSHLYPKFDQSKFQINDVALIELDRPVKYTNWVRPICLPNREKVQPGTICVAAGWGLTVENSSTPSNKLQHVDLPIVDIDTCMAAYSKAKVRPSRDLNICAGYVEGGKDACKGDSGGPLVCQRCGSCGWFLAGVTSFGAGCARKGFYGVYTNVLHYEEWLLSITGIAAGQDRSCTGPYYSAWSAWGVCTITCGIGGTRKRTRTCLNKKTASDSCSGASEETERCPTVACPTWGKYGKWEDCTVTCGGGVQIRSRKCVNGEIGKAGCPADEASETRKCNENPCPASWSEWGVWGTCSKTCGDGSRTATRTCIPGINKSARCPGNSKKTENCKIEECKGRLGAWSQWSKCSADCDKGEATRTRKCVDGTVCDGLLSEKRECQIKKCPGTWSKWQEWKACSVSCAGGKRNRERTCSNDLCVGISKQTEDCNTQLCPYFGEWGPWEECSGTCGKGMRDRRRKCFKGKIGDVGCDKGGEIENEECENVRCPEYGKWSDWTECSVTCGNGRSTRSRVCLHSKNPTDCKGPSKEVNTCNNGKCPGKWTDWSTWTRCTSSCGKSTKNRKRECVGGKVGEPGCDTGKAIETKNCDTKPCPSKWGDWKPWSRCSKSCDRGITYRERKCLNGKPGEGDCVPATAARKEKLCNEITCIECFDQFETYCKNVYPNQAACSNDALNAQNFCPKTCNYCPSLHELWQAWSPCSSPCGAGTQTRTRVCKNSVLGCEGESQETGQCVGTSCKGFAQWSSWGPCSVTCGDGKRTRSRTCPHDKCNPDENGKSSLTDEGKCGTPCVGSWKLWSTWGSCSVTCGLDGFNERTRQCVGGKPGGPGCAGSDKERKRCRNQKECPGKWSEWSKPSQCSVTCGNGQTTRTRTCTTGGRVGISNCIGSTTKTESCNQGKCVVKWGDFGPWDTCDVTCGGGMRSRKRNCQGGNAGDTGCEGSDTEKAKCGTEACPANNCGALTDTATQCPLFDPAECNNARSNFKSYCAKTCCEAYANGSIQKADACADDLEYEQYCRLKQLCTQPLYVELMKAKCKKSCGHC